MAQELVGEQRNLDVWGKVTVNGGVDGATVRPDGSLTVNGAVTGHLQIAEGAVIMINGALADVTADSQGTMLATGAIEVPWADLDRLGRFAVMPGSVVNRRILNEDGTLRPPQDRYESININMNDTDWCVWVRDEQAFVPMAEIERRTDELGPSAGS